MCGFKSPYSNEMDNVFVFPVGDRRHVVIYDSDFMLPLTWEAHRMVNMVTRTLGFGPNDEDAYFPWMTEFVVQKELLSVLPSRRFNWLRIRSRMYEEPEEPQAPDTPERFE